MLHITNGDSATERLRQAGIAGTLLSWRDVLHEGPLPAGHTLDQLRPIRARFLAEQGWGQPDAILAEFAARDAALADVGRHDEAVLWFEHDLYDQLQLLQLLDWFADQQPGTSTLSLAQSDSYLGATTAEQLQTLFADRRPVTAAQLALGRRTWQALCAPDPAGLVALLDDDTAALPYLAPALRRHLQEFPAAGSGLSRTESQALAVLADGSRSLRDLYIAAHQQQEPAVFMGDTIFAGAIRRLSDGPAPLVLLAEAVAAPDASAYQRMLDATISLTDAGRAVLNGQHDQIALNGIDRWLGGVHLQGRAVRWRWSLVAGRLEPSAS